MRAVFRKFYNPYFEGTSQSGDRSPSGERELGPFMRILGPIYVILKISKYKIVLIFMTERKGDFSLLSAKMD